ATNRRPPRLTDLMGAWWSWKESAVPAIMAATLILPGLPTGHHEFVGSAAVSPEAWSSELTWPPEAPSSPRVPGHRLPAPSGRLVDLPRSELACHAGASHPVVAAAPVGP